MPPSHEASLNMPRIASSRAGVFTLRLAERPPIPVLIAAPHGGRAYPDVIIDQMRRPEFSTLRLEDRHVDALATRVAEATGAALLVAHAPRAMVDLNRATDDVDWAMVEGEKPEGAANSLSNRRARSGLGLVPRRLPGVGELWRAPLSAHELERRIDTIHRPYHAALARALEALRDQWGTALLVDLHSMPPLKPRSDAEPAAEFVIGDRFGASCSPVLSAEVLRYLASESRLVAHNRPYAGGYVLDRHAQPSRGIHAIQIEVCRSLYLDEAMDEMTPRAAGLVRLLSGLVRMLASEIATLSDDSRTRLAAE